MATVIDEFIVRLGLDPAAFKAGQKKVRDESKKTADQVKEDADETEEAAERSADKVTQAQLKKAAVLERLTKREAEAKERAGKQIAVVERKRTVDQEENQKRQRQGFQLSKNELLGYLTVFTAGKALLDFARDTIVADAATGRLAQNVGTSTEHLAEWQGMLKTAGGTAADANSDVSKLAANLQAFNLHGQAPMAQYFVALRLQLKDLQDPTNAFLKISEQFQQMPRQRAFQINNEMGFSQAMFNTLIQGPDAVRRLMEAQRQLNTVNDESTKKAEQAQAALANLATASENLGRSVLFNLTPSLVQLTDTLSDLAADEGFHKLTEIMGGMAAFTAQGVAEILTGKPQGTDRKAFGPYKQGYELGTARIGDVGGTGPLDMGPKKFRGNSAFTKAGAGPGAPAVASASGGDFARVAGKLQAMGMPADQAAAVAAGLGSESNFNPKASLTDKTGTTYGLAQWRGKRQRDLFAQFGANPSEDDQLKFLMQELQTTHKDVGDKLNGMTDRSAMLDTFIRQFEAPGDGIAGDLKRGGQLLAANPGGNSTTVSIAQITVQTQATDAQGIATDLSQSLRQQLVQQANRGMF